jgi:hypothetical protein
MHRRRRRAEELKALGLRVIQPEVIREAVRLVGEIVMSDSGDLDHVFSPSVLKLTELFYDELERLDPSVDYTTFSALPSRERMYFACAVECMLLDRGLVESALREVHESERP